MTTLLEKEQQVQNLLMQGAKDDAIKLLSELTVDYAKSKNFLKAEELREMIITIDPMALAEIIGTAEIIESEKTASIDDNHKSIWRDFYALCREDECNAFYFSLKQASLAPNKLIIEQGRLNNRLFFPDQGRLKVIVKQGKKEMFVTEIREGATVGHDTFFPISISTSSIITVTPVKVRYIERPEFEQMELKFPGFEEKLNSFCTKSEKDRTEDILKQKEIERRQTNRVKTSGKVATQLVDAKGEALGNCFNGELADASIGGVSYLIKCSKKETARMLLGRTCSVATVFASGKKATKKGYIVGVTSHHYNDYSIHLKYLNPLTQDEFVSLISLRN